MPRASVLALGLTATGAGSASDAHALYSAIRTLVFTLAVPLSLASLATGYCSGWGRPGACSAMDGWWPSCASN